MKLKVTSLLLALLLLFGMVIPAGAASPEETGEEEVIAADVETEENSEEEEGSESPFYLGDQQLTTLEYLNKSNTNYVTVESFLAALCSESMVEEEKGVLTASAVMVTEVVEVETSEEGIEAANVVEETLSLTVRNDGRYVVANDRCLYLPGGTCRVNDKLALPIRTLAKLLNLEISVQSGRVALQHIEGTGMFLTSGEEFYDEETLYWLSHIIYAESGNQLLEGKIAVGNVVMNRVNNKSFPNTIKGVLFQKNQFAPASSGSIYRNPNAESIAAAKLVLEGVNVADGVLFFNRAGMNTYASRCRAYVATIGAHAFYK